MDKRSDPAFTYSRSELFFTFPTSGSSTVGYFTGADRFETVVGVRVYALEEILEYPILPTSDLPPGTQSLAPCPIALMARTRLTLCDVNKDPIIEEIPCTRCCNAHIANVTFAASGTRNLGPLVPLKIKPLRVNLSACRINQDTSGQAVLVELFYL